MSGTYVTDITHYLDDSGHVVADMPVEARQMASFLTLLIDEASQAIGVRGHETSVRCRSESCQGNILVSLPSPEESITWCCPDCGHNGIINNWQGTKWNRREAQGG